LVESLPKCQFIPKSEKIEEIAQKRAFVVFGNMNSNLNRGKNMETGIEKNRQIKYSFLSRSSKIPKRFSRF
jgi:hypothetical protein